MHTTVPDMRTTETGTKLNQCGEITKAEVIMANTMRLPFTDKFMEMQIMTEAAEEMITGVMTMAEGVTTTGIAVMARETMETGTTTMAEEAMITVNIEGSKDKRPR